MELPHVAHVERGFEPNPVGRNAFGLERRAGAGRHLGQDRPRIFRHDGLPLPRPRPHVIVLQIREQHAHRAEHGRLPGDDDQRHLQFAGQHAGVQRPGAAGHDEGELARVVAAFDRHDAQRRGHVGVDEPIDALGCFKRRQAERLRNATDDGPFRGRGVQGDLPAQQSVRVEIAQDQIGVRDGRLGASASVADRPGPGAGALRPDAEHAACVYPGDTPAAGADGVDVQDGQRDPVPADGALGRRRRPAVVNRTHVETRAAHIYAQHVA